MVKARTAHICNHQHLILLCCTWNALLPYLLVHLLVTYQCALVTMHRIHLFARDKALVRRQICAIVFQELLATCASTAIAQAYQDLTQQYALVVEIAILPISVPVMRDIQATCANTASATD